MLIGEINWTPTIGDPTVGGWITVAAYSFTAWLCLLAYRSEIGATGRSIWTVLGSTISDTCRDWRNPAAATRPAFLWLFMIVAMCGLGVNKQLDLQTLLTEIGRELAKAGGWYEARSVVQLAFISLVAVLGIGTLIGLNLLVRHDLPGFLLPLGGLALTVTFVVARAASFHGFDRFISIELLGLKMNWIVELTGIGLIAVGAIKRRIAVDRKTPAR